MSAALPADIIKITQATTETENRTKSKKQPFVN